MGGEIERERGWSEKERDRRGIRARKSTDREEVETDKER